MVNHIGAFLINQAVKRAGIFGGKGLNLHLDQTAACVGVDRHATVPVFRQILDLAGCVIGEDRIRRGVSPIRSGQGPERAQVENGVSLGNQGRAFDKARENIGIRGRSAGHFRNATQKFQRRAGLFGADGKPREGHVAIGGARPQVPCTDQNRRDEHQQKRGDQRLMMSGHSLMMGSMPRLKGAVLCGMKRDWIRLCRHLCSPFIMGIFSKP